MFSMGCFTIYIIIALILILPLLFAQLITGAFVTLGFTPGQALLLLIGVLFGGLINIPIKKWPIKQQEIKSFNIFFFPQSTRRYKILAINVGGAIIPGAVSIWEIYRILTEFSTSFPNAPLIFLGILFINIIISYNTARPVEGKGIAMPALIPPVVVSVPSIILLPEIAPVIAFPAGVLGVLIGADIMHLKDIKKMNTPIGSIGGAGTFDGIFLCGILSVLLTG
ncbi:MAG: DUF1614 domain-containing protein [Elusimicrobiota bacterium]